MYCPNCKAEYAGKFCPECGTKLIEKPLSGGFNINLGDANAISGGINLSDHSVHNTTNVNNVTHNITNVAAQKTEIEILQEKKLLYLNECKRAYEDHIIDQSEVIALEDYRIKLGLDKSTAESILASVRKMADQGSRKPLLNPLAKIKAKQLRDHIEDNDREELMDQIDSYDALVNKYDDEDLSFDYYSVLAALKPEKCISLMEKIDSDSYWQSFWSYLAYIKLGKISEAGNVLVSFDRFVDYPEDNITVLAAAGSLITGNYSETEIYLEAITGDYSENLEPLCKSVESLWADSYLSESEKQRFGIYDYFYGCPFYEENIFNEEEESISIPELIRIEKEQKKAYPNVEIQYSPDDPMVLISVRGDNLETFEVVEGVRSIGERAFYGCGSLKSVKLPSTLDNIGEYAFAGGTGLESIHIPEGVQTIGSYAFADGRLSSVVIPKSVKIIGENAFIHNCLKSVTISDGVEVIGEKAFYENCLQSVTIPSSVEGYGPYTFGCNNLYEVYLPSHLKKKYDYSFNGWTEVKIVNNKYKDDRFIFSRDGKVLRKCLDKQIESYTVPYGVEEIDEQAFWFCHKLKEIKFPSSLRVIGIFAFAECGLKTLSIPDGVKEIGDSAFNGCRKLEELYLPSSLRIIGSQAFAYCDLKTIRIPSGVEFICSEAFDRNHSLAEVSFPSTLRFIGNLAFRYTALTSVAIPENVKGIGVDAFTLEDSEDNEKKIIKVTLPQHLRRFKVRGFGESAVFTEV